jgi:hypothetical protein
MHITTKCKLYLNANKYHLQIQDPGCVNSVTYYGNYVTLYSQGIISFALQVSNLDTAKDSKAK